MGQDMSISKKEQGEFMQKIFHETQEKRSSRGARRCGMARRGKYITLEGYKLEVGEGRCHGSRKTGEWSTLMGSATFSLFCCTDH